MANIVLYYTDANVVDCPACSDKDDASYCERCSGHGKVLRSFSANQIKAELEREIYQAQEQLITSGTRPTAEEVLTRLARTFGFVEKKLDGPPEA